MSDSSDDQLYDQLYWRKVGWKAHEFGLPADVSDADVLEFEQKKRAAAQGLAESASWFEIYCAEFHAGIEPIAPDYCDTNEAELMNQPPEALEVARIAATIFSRSTS